MNCNQRRNAKLAHSCGKNAQRYVLPQIGGLLVRPCRLQRLNGKVQEHVMLPLARQYLDNHLAYLPT
jgi:hypothetical protein